MSENSDLSWLTIGAHICVGPSELEKYVAAADRAGFDIRWEDAGPEWGADALRGTRVA